MFNRKLKLSLLVLLLLVAGCSSPATVAPAPTNMVLPPTPIAVSTEAPIIPTQQDVLSQPGARLITIRFDQPMRIVPDALNPRVQSAEIIAQYHDITSNMSEEWAGGSTSKVSAFGLQIDPVAQDKTIMLKYPIHVSVAQKNSSADNLNMIIPMGGGGGGGGDVRMFSQLLLEVGEYDFAPMDPSPVILSSSFPYRFTNVTCLQPGAFDLTFTIPYSASDASGSQDFAETYAVSFVCPQSVTMWGEQNGQLQKLVRLIFKNGEYVQPQ